MAENPVVLNKETIPGGDSIACDDIGGIKYQQIKLAIGGDGVNEGTVSTANPMPVTGSVTIDAGALATSAKQDAQTAVLNTLATEATLALLKTFLESGTLNISAATLPLPNGAATSDNQVSEITILNSILSTLASESTAQLILGALASTLSVQVVDFLAASLPLPTNAAQETGGNLASIKTNTDTPTTPYNNKVTVTTAATRVQLNSNRAVKSVTIKAGVTNTGIIYVGDSTVSSSNGLELNPGDTVSMDISNLNVLYIDASINSQYVTYIAVN